MRLSSDHARLVALFFEDQGVAHDFFGMIKSLTADPTDPMLSVSRGRRPDGRKKSGRRTTNPISRIGKSKASISGPCCFAHVTRMLHADAVRVLSKSGIARL